MAQRSPIVVALLFAASLCACAVALYWTSQWSDYADIAYLALLGGYLSVVCLWSALRPRMNVWTRSAPVAAVIVASMAFGLTAPNDFIAYLAFFGAHAALLLCALWVFRRSRYWQRRTGIETDWQFSIAQLLAVMTAVALLTVAFQSSNLWNDGGDDTAAFIGFVGGSTLLAIAAACVWSLRRHWLLRLAAVLAAAIGVGAPFYFERSGVFALVFAVYYFLIQALVLAMWLAWGGILPLKELSETIESQS